MFFVSGGDVELFQPFAIVDTIDEGRSLDVEELAEQGPRFGDVEFDLGSPFARMS